MSGDKMALQTQPHSRTWGGLRGHSIGSHYPLSVVGYGDGTWQVQNIVTGKLHGKRVSIDEAHALADLLSARRRAALGRKR